MTAIDINDLHRAPWNGVVRLARSLGLYVPPSTGDTRPNRRRLGLAVLRAIARTSVQQGLRPEMGQTKLPVVG